MKELSEYNVRQILCGAIRAPLLIITVSEDTAMQIKRTILQVLRECFYENLCKQQPPRYQIFIRGYERITVMPLRKWSEQKCKLLHEGIVIVTSRQITYVPFTRQAPMLLDNYLMDGWEKAWYKGGERNGDNTNGK